MNYECYRDLLNEELERRKQINAAYSLRAFARDLGISAPRLSQVLSKKQGLSVEAAKEIAQKIKLAPKEMEWFCSSAGALHARNFKLRKDFKERIHEHKRNAKAFTEIQLEYFKVISDWYHFAILELTHLKNFQNDARWIAEVLGITTAEAKAAIVRMKGLSLLKEEDGKLTDVFTNLSTGNDVPSNSVKNFHLQLMKLAMNAVYEQDLEQREISSNVISINRKDLPLFKERLRKFRKEFNQGTAHAKSKDAVYCLNQQFFELTRRKP